MEHGDNWCYDLNGDCMNPPPHGCRECIYFRGTELYNGCWEECPPDVSSCNECPYS